MYPKRRWRKTLEALGVSHYGRLGGLGVGPNGPTWQGLVPCLGMVSSRTFLRSSHEIIP
jgi:hypothetical protein